MKPITERDALLQLALPEPEQDIYALLREPMRVSEIGRALKIPTATVSIYVGRLKAKGLVRRKSRGLYYRRFGV